MFVQTNLTGIKWKWKAAVYRATTIGCFPIKLRMLSTLVVIKIQQSNTSINNIIECVWYITQFKSFFYSKLGNYNIQ